MLFVHDHDRPDRIGMPEAVLCSTKSPGQIAPILAQLIQHRRPALLTRLDQDVVAGLPGSLRSHLDYDPVSRTALVSGSLPPRPGVVAIVAAGTSDHPIAAEAGRTLEFSGISTLLVIDVGVAGLWRLEARLPEIRSADAVIVVAGMDAALVSVVGGLVAAPVVAVPTSVGYGVAARGRVALGAALASCAQGVTVVNVDNGFGAACAAVRVLSLLKSAEVAAS